MSDWSTLSKKELLELLESYDDEKHIVFKVNLKQGVVGFWDVKKDEINSDTDKLVLMSPALDKWYAEDIQELTDENEQLKSENKRLTDKLNKIALELVGEVISQGKAVEISEMSYNEFLDYRAKNGKPMELQL
jgi:predicted HTH domain antitoxin